MPVATLSVRLDSLRSDLVFGFRQLRKNKLASAAAMVSLALALGSCASAFRLIDALLLRPLPIAQPDRLFALSREGFLLYGKPATVDSWEYPLLRRMRAAVSNQATLIAISFAENVDVTYGSDPDFEKAHVQYVSGSMFGSFGLRPALGRLLTAEDDLQPGAHPVAVLSNDYWSHRFGRDPNVIGRTFRLGDRLYQIVGVATEGFTGTEPGTVIDIFMPAMMHWGVTHADWSVFRAFLHLPPRIAVEPVRDRLRVALRAWSEETAKQFPDRLKHVLLMEPAAAGVSGIQKNYRLSLATLSVLVILVLFIACANVANLMTAQAAARTREMALRVAMGAGRGRLIQLVLVESATLAFPAMVSGALFAWWAAPFIVNRINSAENPVRLFLPADGRVLGFGLALTLAVTFLFGLGPALRASRVQPAAALKGGDDPRSRRRWMDALIALQVAFCFLVLFVAGLLVASFDRLSHQPTGFSAERLLNITVVTKRHESESLWDQVAERLRGVPGVESVAFSDWPLLDGWGFKYNALSINGALPTDALAWFINVSPGWIDTMKIPLLDGRDFRPNDISPGAAIVNESFARQYFNAENPIGKWFAGSSGYMRGQRFQIIGLVRNARYRYLRQEILPVAYTPFHRMDDAGTMLGGTFVVRTAGSNPLALASILRQEIPRARPEFRVSSIRTERELIGSQTVRERLLAMLALFFASVAVLLSAVGLYGVLAYTVYQRRREIGIRMAIGAQSGDIARRVTAEVFGMVFAGGLAGLAGGLASVRYLATLLYEVKSTDPAMLALPSFTILAAAALAALPSALRAMRIDPVAMLRSE